MDCPCVYYGDCGSVDCLNLVVYQILLFFCLMYIVLVRTPQSSGGEFIDYHYEPRLDLAVRTAKRLKGKVVHEDKLKSQECRCHQRAK